jgi:galactokinase/CTP:molybdopterin cytidylyltransferase MocA
MKLSDIKAGLDNLVAAEGSELQRRAARLTRLCDMFFAHYGDGEVSLLRAPARINVLGEHVDYVSYMPTASLTFGSRERDALMLYRPSAEPIVRCVSSSARYAPVSFSICDTAVPKFGPDLRGEWLNFLFAHGTPKPGWQNYVAGAVAFARGRFGEAVRAGFDFALDSDIPPGGGASSSSAVVVLAGAAIRNVNSISWSAEELAKDSAVAEWFIGTRGGSMDHITICLAQPASAVLIDYAAGQTSRVPLPAEPFQWLTFFSKSADKGREIMIEYNERAAVSRVLIPALLAQSQIPTPDTHSAWRDLLASLPETISIETLSAAYPDAFTELERTFPALVNERSRWPLKVRARALHHLGEVQRVALATQTLRSVPHADPAAAVSAMQSVGKLLDESHASLRDLYEVSAPEVEELINLIRADPHVLGARLMGGGFGGNVLALTTSEHAQTLIERVQQHYYAPRDRHGVREGSVMVSTPGPGLDHVDVNELWRDSIAHISSLGVRAAAHATQLRSLIDVASGSVDPREVWPVIVAAGKGSRASESGLDLPKPLAIIDEQPAIVHVLRSVRERLGDTRPPIVIVSPETASAIAEALHGENVLYVTQPEPLGTGDAVLHAGELMGDFTGTALVVWSTQPIIRPRTFARAAKLAQLFAAYEMIVPTVFVEHPYAPIRRNSSGQIDAATETHLESADAHEFGETNIGMFVVRNQTMFAVLRELHDRYWDRSTRRYNRSRGELGFPNELITALAARDGGVFASPFADPREEQGIKRLSDLSRCERFLSELKKEEQREAD